MVGDVAHMMCLDGERLLEGASETENLMSSQPPLDARPKQAEPSSPGRVGTGHDLGRRSAHLFTAAVAALVLLLYSLLTVSRCAATLSLSALLLPFWRAVPSHHVVATAELRHDFLWMRASKR